MGDVEPPVAVCHKQTDSSLVFTSHNALHHLITWPPACNSRFSLSGIKLDLYLYNPLHTKLYLLTPPIQCVLMQITTAAMPETQIPLPVGTPRCCEVGLLASSRLGRGAGSSPCVNALLGDVWQGRRGNDVSSRMSSTRWSPRLLH